MRSSLILFLILSTALARATRAENEILAHPIPLELRVFDVSDLIKAPVDFPAPNMSLNVPSNVVDPFTGTPVQSNLNIANLTTLLHDRMFAAAFADATTSIAEENGCLVVVQRMDIQKQIGQFLSTLRATLRPQMVVKGMLVASAEIPAASIFDSEALAKVLGPKGSAAALASPRLICSNAQRVHVRSGTMFNYISDYDVAGAVYDPVIATALDGYIFEVRPTLSSDRSCAQVDVNFQFNTRTGKSETRNIVMAPPAVAASSTSTPTVPMTPAIKPIEEPPTESAPNAMRLPIEIPSMNSQQIRTQVRVPAGKWVLAGVMNNPNTQAKENRLLLFISADVAEKTPAGKAEEKSKRK